MSLRENLGPIVFTELVRVCGSCWTQPLAIASENTVEICHPQDDDEFNNISGVAFPWLPYHQWTKPRNQPEKNQKVQKKKCKQWERKIEVCVVSWPWLSQPSGDGTTNPVAVMKEPA